MILYPNSAFFVAIRSHWRATYTTAHMRYAVNGCKARPAPIDRITPPTSKIATPFTAFF